MSLQLEGIIPPLITPLNPDASLDRIGLERLLEQLIAGGVAGFFLLGTCGEGPSLPDSTKAELVSAVSEQARGRARVLVGVPGAGTRQTIELAKSLTRHGGDAIVVLAPYYFVHTQQEVVAHVTAVARSVDVPTFVYNIPRAVKTVIEPATIARLAELPEIIGVKDSSADMVCFQDLLAIRKRHPGFLVFQGIDELAAISIIRGADGGVLGLANIAPGICCDLFAAARSGDLARAWALQERLRVLGTLLGHGQSIPCLKMAVSMTGLCGPTAVAPFLPLGESAVVAIRSTLTAAGVIPQA